MTVQQVLSMARSIIEKNDNALQGPPAPRNHFAFLTSPWEFDINAIDFLRRLDFYNNRDNKITPLGKLSKFYNQKSKACSHLSYLNKLSIPDRVAFRDRSFHSKVSSRKLDELFGINGHKKGSDYYNLVQGYKLEEIQSRNESFQRARAQDEYTRAEAREYDAIENHKKEQSRKYFSVSASSIDKQFGITRSQDDPLTQLNKYYKREEKESKSFHKVLLRGMKSVVGLLGISTKAGAAFASLKAIKTGFNFGKSVIDKTNSEYISLQHNIVKSTYSGVTREQFNSLLPFANEKGANENSVKGVLSTLNQGMAALENGDSSFWHGLSVNARGAEGIAIGNSTFENFIALSKIFDKFKNDKTATTNLLRFFNIDESMLEFLQNIHKVRQNDITLTSDDSITKEQRDRAATRLYNDKIRELRSAKKVEEANGLLESSLARAEQFFNWVNFNLDVLNTDSPYNKYKIGTQEHKNYLKETERRRMELSATLSEAYGLGEYRYNRPETPRPEVRYGPTKAAAATLEIENLYLTAPVNSFESLKRELEAETARQLNYLSNSEGGSL